MAKLVFNGWRIGMRKVAFTILLHHKAGLTLKEAQSIKLKVLDEVPTEIYLDNITVAKDVAIEADSLGVNVELIE